MALNDCLPKLLDYFFFVVSTLAFRLSFAAVAAESIVVLAESAAAVTLSLATVAAESTLVSVLEEPLQAANAPIANTTKSFFIVICLIVNDFMLIPRSEKSNLATTDFHRINFKNHYNLLIIRYLLNKKLFQPDSNCQILLTAPVFLGFLQPVGLRFFTFSIK
jgi:hypothetical protein